MKEEIMTLPLLALRGMIVFPGMITNLDVGRTKSLQAVDAAMEADRRILLVCQKDAEVTEIGLEDLYRVGTLAEVKQFLKLPNGAIRILVEGLERVEADSITEFAGENNYFVGHYHVLTSTPGAPQEIIALTKLLLEKFEQWIMLTKKLSADVLQNVKFQKDPSLMADMIAGYLTLDPEKKQEILEIPDTPTRMRALVETIALELEIADLEKKIAKEVHDNIEKNQKEYYLREQLKVVSQQLGDADDLETELEKYRQKMARLNLSHEVKAKLEKEMGKLRRLTNAPPEAAVVRNYIEAVLDLPWGKFTEDNFDLQHAEQVLNKEHYGLEKIKERILEYLAVRALSKNLKGPILCLVGPPGVGKTSLAQSVAHALGRKFTRFSLGGVHDEAEIRGHRRTYIGSMPGRIIHGMQSCGCMNPVFLLDEIDKLTADYKGDPAAALLEALDPEQNNTFSDHFIELPFDLSHVFWIVTANNPSTIPAALYDRMEVIELSSYTDEEKEKIAELHLLPKEREQHGLSKRSLNINEAAIKRIIRDYTREAGVRNLERKLATVCRKVARKIVAGECKVARVTEKNLEKYLGPIIYLEEDMETTSQVGVCNGLAWTSVGGELLKVEVLCYKGKGALTLTGKLGEVMKESAQAGFTYIRSRAKELGLVENFYETEDLHIHVPEGAVPKDGPSAGITMVTAMVSALTKRPVKGKLAMTGELTLSGRVLPIGGLKEKVLAAYRYGIKTIVLPRRNYQDIEEIPEDIRQQLEFIPVGHMDEVLRVALEEKHE